MACKKTNKNTDNMPISTVSESQSNTTGTVVPEENMHLIFGVESKVKSNIMLQNNIDLFEWVKRNKKHPSFWGRNINGNNCLSKEEVQFLHSKACKVGAIYHAEKPKITEEDGVADGEKAVALAKELGIRRCAAIFMDIDPEETLTWKYMRGYASVIVEARYVPGFKANTDAMYFFDREFSRGIQNDTDIFSRCVIWATSPNLPEFYRVTTTHYIHPDEWSPFAPSGIRKKDVAVWEYGKECHPIFDDKDNEVTFNVNLVRNRIVYLEEVF